MKTRESATRNKETNAGCKKQEEMKKLAEADDDGADRSVSYGTDTEHLRILLARKTLVLVTLAACTGKCRLLPGNRGLYYRSYGIKHEAGMHQPRQHSY